MSSVADRFDGGEGGHDWCRRRLGSVEHSIRNNGLDEACGFWNRNHVLTRRVDRHQLIIALRAGLTLTGNGPAKLILGGAGNDTMVGLVDPNILFGDDDEDRVIAGMSSF
jgi:hypothetical protein